MNFNATVINQADEWRYYIQILARRKWALIVLCIAATCAGYSLAMLSSDKYEASALILVRPAKNIEFSNSGSKEILNAPVGNAQTETPGKTYIELARSYTVVARVTELLDLVDDDPLPKDDFIEELKYKVKEYLKAAVQLLKYGQTFEVDPFVETVRAVQEGLDLATTLETYVFNVSFESEEPEKAANIVNTVVDVFMDYLVEINRRESEEILSYLQTELDTAHEAFIEAGREFQAFKDEHSTYSPEDEYLEQLKILTSLEIQYETSASSLASSRQKLGASHPDVAPMLAEQEYLVAAIKARKAVLKSLPEVEKELRLLKLQLDTSQSAYEFLKRERDEARVRAAKSTPETVVVARAVPPTTPTKARYALSAGLSFMVALIIGPVVLFLLEFFNSSIRTVDAANRLLDLPVLATVPPLPSAR